MLRNPQRKSSATQTPSATTGAAKPKLDNFGAAAFTMRSPVLAGAVAAVVSVLCLYLFRITGLMPVGGGEMHAIQASSSLSSLADNPLLLPFKLLAFALLQLPVEDVPAVRLASIIIMCLCGVLFFMLAERWYGLVNGSLATILFVTSGGVVQPGRYGAGLVCLVFITLLLLNLVVWANTSKSSNRVILCYAVSCGLALLMPGGVWLAIAATILGRKLIIGHLRRTSARTTVIASSALALGAALLLFALARDISLIWQWLGIPDTLPSIVTLVKQAASSIAAFTVRGPFMPEVWLAHTPILDAASSILFITGLLFYARHAHNPRTLLLIVFFAIGAILVTLNGAVALGFLVPIVYLVIAGGLSYFLYQWKRVFPSNPIAQVTAFGIVGVLMLCIVSFHTQRYFIAWRYSPNTVQAYQRATEGRPDPNPTPYLVQ